MDEIDASCSDLRNHKRARRSSFGSRPTSVTVSGFTPAVRRLLGNREGRAEGDLRRLHFRQPIDHDVALEAVDEMASMAGGFARSKPSRVRQSSFCMAAVTCKALRRHIGVLSARSSAAREFLRSSSIILWRRKRRFRLRRIQP